MIFSSGVEKIVTNGHAFAAIKEDGSVITWGSENGGDSSSVINQLSSGVKKSILKIIGLLQH